MTLAAIATGLAAGSLVVPSAAQSAPAQIRSVTPPASTLAVIKTIGVGAAPTGVAVNGADDTVYVSNWLSGNVSIINGRTGQRTDDTIPVGASTYPIAVAVNQADDSVYVVSQFNLTYMLVVNGRTGLLDDTISVPVGSGGVAVDQIDDTVYVTDEGTGMNTLTIIDGRLQTVAGTVSIGNYPFGVAVNDSSDTVYVANFDANSVSVVDGGALSNYISVGTGPAQVAVNQRDDTVYVTNRLNASLSVIDGASGLVSSTVPVGSAPERVAVDQVDDTVYVVNRSSNNVTVINGRTAVRTDDTINVGSSPYGVAVDDTGVNGGLVYVSNSGSDSVSAIGRVTPTAAPASGYADDTFTMTLTVPNLSPSFSMADNTVTSVTFGGTPATVTPGAGDTWTVTVPTGTFGSTVPVIATFNGGLSTSLGDFTYSLLPTCASSTFTTDDSCTVAPGETVAFTVVSGAGGAGGPGGAGGIGGAGYQCSPANGGLGGNGGTGGTGGSSLAVSGTYTNSTNAPVTLNALVGANGAAGAPGAAGNAGPDGTFLSTTGQDGTDGTDGLNGQNGTPSSIAVNGGATLVSAGAGTGGVRGIKGTKGLGGSGSPGCTAGANGTNGTAGSSGFAGNLITPGSLPAGWTSAPGTGSPRVAFTVPTPTPDPVYPPGAPTDVTAEAGNASATVTWRAPANSGSFPITNYRAVAQPGGQSCLVAAPTLTCTVSGLTNGQAYTFTVEALNGAGWGAQSEASEPVTPESRRARLVLNQGTRVADGVHDRIITTGTSVNVPAGVKLTPYIRLSGQSAFSEGKATISVANDGTFRWTRKISKNRGITAYVAWEDVESNRVFWAKIR